MFEQVAETVEENSLVKTGDAVLVALSGGADSVVMLHILNRTAGEYNLTLHAVHVDHQIRPAAAEQEAAFCRDLCARLKVPLTIVTEDVPELARRQKKGIEEAARHIRYQVFARLADNLGCNRIALAHHTDDQVETILFRILRGTGRTGLRAIPLKRGRYIRPLLHVTRDDILKYAAEHDLTYCTDESNIDPAFTRNYIRHRLLPEIRERLNPSVDTALLNLAETVGEEEKYLEVEVDKVIGKVVGLTVGGKLTIDLKRFAVYAVWIRRRVLRRCLMALWQSAYPPDRAVIARLESLTDNEEGALSLPGRIQARVHASRLYLFRKHRRRAERKLDIAESLTIPGLFAELRCDEIRYRGKDVRVRRRSRTILVDRSKVTPPLSVRYLRSGDRFRPLGMRGTKKVGDFLTDRKVPGVLRDELLLIGDRHGPIWLVTFEIDDRVKITSTTQKVLRIEYRERQKDRANALRALVGSG